MTRVLVVDDKEDNLYYLQALLSGKDYTVDSARHGAEALVKARQSPPDVVICDLLMPVMDGYTLLRHWKADNRLKQVPFMVYTATYTKTEDEQLALNLGADAFILKPAEPEDFLARLGEVLANAASTGPILPKISSRDKKALLKVYSETLIHKLEEKTLQLEEKSRKLEQTNRALQQEIIERKTAEARIKYLSRVQAMLSGINTLIVRVQDRDELFRGACRIAVGTGGFSMALLVIVDPATKKVVSIVSEGKDEALMASVKKLLSTSMNVSNTMVATAIKAKQAIVSNDSQNDPRVLLSKQYTEAGIGSLMILPLMIAGEAVGTFTLYSDQIDFFHEDEIELLNELASDIAFAIDHLDKQRKLNYLAYYDALTGLANRTLFLERVDQFIRNAGNGHRIAVFLIDLERFKNFNDSFGQPTGDKLLKHVAEWLSDFSKDANLVAHIDADHFAAVMPQIASDGKLAHLIENALASLLENSFQLEDAKFRISAKIGAALFPDDGADAETLFRNAEAALKTAKKSGSRYLFHTKKMTEAVISKLTLENQLRQAIDNEDFVLHYQPKVNLASGTVTGAEALIRWNDPRTGLVPPGKFIPILEETGLIYEVGRWAMHKAIEDNLRWRKAGLPAVRIAVNVSPLQLRNPGFIAEIERKIGIDANAAEGLELEITESMIMTDIKHSISMLKKIRRMGVTIAVDDFGTGFSSLGYLAKLPVDTLKIDRSFVIGMSDSPEGLALVSTIISLAHALKLKVVAEGVETEEQSHLLHLLSCDQIQGYLFSKPVPCEEFETKFLAPPPPINDKGI